jgi:hypothetical protein
MKRITLLFTLCFSIIHLSAQTDKKNMIGTHAAFGIGGYGPVWLLGAPSFKTKYFCAFGLDYSKQLSKRWSFNSGLEYTYNEMTVTHHDFPEIPPHKANLQLATIPLQMKYYFGKVVYLNGGLLLNIVAKERMNSLWVQDKIEKTNVAMLLGVGLGIGFEHEFSSGITLSLNPYARLNGIGAGMSLQSNSQKHYKYLQSGVSFGVGYKF